MKKASHKNQIIITALAVMIVVAGYLNFTGQEISTSGLKKSSKETVSDNNSQNVDDSSGSQAEKTDEEDFTTDISAEDKGNDDYVVADSGEVVASEESPGEAVMVSNTIGADYFASAKLTREQTRAKNKETLMNIVNNKSVASADKQSAIKQVANITKNSERENAAELMLQAKGFQNAIVSISDGNADVVVDSNGLTEKQIAQVEDIVRRKTGIESDKIVITPVKVTDNNE
ncbi:MAG TPA: stage III sporulation protein AH [Lachnospiraceae bacterium]|nr:stage III sporulation protein AH [Lachnospiraceae bacterium]